MKEKLINDSLQLNILCSVNKRCERKENDKKDFECGHKVVIFCGYQKHEVDTLLEIADDVLEEAVYYCLDCGKLITIPLTRRFEEIIKFESQVNIILELTEEIRQKDLNELKEYYDSLLGDCCEEETIKIFRLNYKA